MNLFKKLGMQNVAKRENHDPMDIELSEFQMEKSKALLDILSLFFELGLIGKLPLGLCPGMNTFSNGDINFLTYLINTTHSEIKILQTYIPKIENIKMEV